MKKMVAGPFPRSEELVRATRLYDRGMIGERELNEYYSKDLSHYLKITEGIDLRSSGLLNWQDLLRPFKDILSGVEVGGLKRYFETNFFFRVLKFSKRPKLMKENVQSWVRVYYYTGMENFIYTLPSPLLFYHYSYGVSLGDICYVLSELVELLDIKGKGVVFLDPSYAFYGASDDEKKELSRFYANLKSKVDGIILIHTYFGNVRDLDFLLSLDVDGVGIDFYRNSIEDVKSPKWSEKIMIGGILNAESPYIEREELKDFVERLDETVKPKELYITFNSEPHFLPHSVAIQKVELLKGWRLK